MSNIVITIAHDRSSVGWAGAVAQALVGQVGISDRIAERLLQVVARQRDDSWWRCSRVSSSRPCVCCCHRRRSWSLLLLLLLLLLLVQPRRVMQSSVTVDGRAQS